MMISNLKQYHDFALVFLIPNVSHLLIYKDNWDKSKVMRKVISELLATAKLSKLYLGTQLDKATAKYQAEQTDCAVVNLHIHNVNLLDYQPKTAEELFAKELQNETNAMDFNNQWIDIENNVSSIAVSINISKSKRRTKSRVKAA
jgi:hypothetical protein